MVSNLSVEEKVVAATKWSTITEVAVKLVNPITNMVLARIISPEAFGVVATINMIISFVDMFTDAGFQKYLVQHEFKSLQEKNKNANVAFWTNLTLSVLLWGVIIVLREKVATLVGNPGMGNVIAIACGQIVLTSFSSIQMALYRREFNFKTLFTVRMISVCIPFFVTIPLALLGGGYWSLVIGSMIIQLSNSIILTIKSSWKPKIFYSVKILREMFSFSIWSLIEAISIWLSCWIDILVVGTVFNQHYLGIYKTSSSMVNVLISVITASIIPVFFSALSRFQNDKIRFNNMYFTVQKLIATLVLPIGVGIYIYSDFVTNILLGSKWSEASQIVGLCAITIAIKVVFCDLCSEVYRAKGKPKISFLAQILHLIVLVPVCIISSKISFWSFVSWRSWIRLEFVIVHFIIIKFAIGIPIGKTIKNVIPVIMACIGMSIFAILIKLVSSSMSWTIISIFLCIIIYFTILSIFPSARKDMKKFWSKVINIK